MPKQWHEKFDNTMITNGFKINECDCHEKFDNTMITNGFKINKCDKCVYIKGTKNGCHSVSLRK